MSDMVRMGLRPASLALAAALCFGTGAHAADGPIVSQATLSLSGLSFQLIDLTPGDGIAPSLSFQTQGVIDSWNVVYDEASDSYLPGGPTYSNSLLPSTPVNYVSPDGLSTVTSTANSVTLQSQLSLSHILPPLTPPDATGAGDALYGGAGTRTDLSVGNPVPGELQAFTLSAGSALVVRGTLTGSYILDGTQVQAGLNANGYTEWTLFHNGWADAGFLMAAQVDNLSEETSGFTGLFGHQVNGFYTSLVNDGATFLSSTDGNVTHQTTASRDFTFTLTNLDDTTMSGVLALSLSVHTDQTLYASRPGIWTPPIDLPPIDVPAIPEPSTYALMGLGLVGIAAAARRRRHTA